MANRTTTHDVHQLYQAQTPITMVTCYDYTFARLVEKAGIDMILIGDSLGNVMQGQETTLPVTVDDIVYHSRSVVRGNGSAMIVADLPFMSYQASPEEGMRNAGRLLKEGGAQAVKVEGGRVIAPFVDKMTSHDIAVVGHLGFTPQSVHKFGGYRVQGRGEEAQQELIADAQALEAAGAFMIVLEMVPEQLARKVTESLSIPTIGIGAGNATSGQVLVLQDLLGMNQSFKPTFVKNFVNLEESVVEALGAYRDEVRQRRFPADEHSFE